MRATYYISFNGTDYTQFYPTNEPKVNLSQESEQIFFRWKVDSFKIGKTKNISLYAILLSWFYDTTKFTTDIYYQIKENGTTTFEFASPISKGKINTQNYIYECTPDPDDAYRPILKQYNRKWQDRVANQLFGNADNLWYNLISLGTFTNVDFTTFTEVAKHIVWSNTGVGTQTAVAGILRQHQVSERVIIRIKNYVPIAGEIKFQLIDQITSAVKSNQVTVNADGFFYLTVTAIGYMDVELSSVGVSSGSFDYDIYYATYTATGGRLYSILNSIFSASYINLPYSTIDDTLLSTILWNDSLGSDPPLAIDTYITAHATNDYVIEGTALWNNIWLARVDSFTINKEDFIETSLADIMLILRKIRLYWFIDEDGNFRIEHERYFREYTPQADLTSATYSKDKPEVDQKIYNYEKEDSYSQLNYSENNQKHEDWLAYPVEFYETIAEPNSKDIRMDVTTDFEYLIDSPGDASSAGLLLLSTDTVGLAKYISLDQSQVTSANYYLNARLGWTWLFANYYDYFAESKTGTINNGVAHTYTHVKEYLKQSNIKFHPVNDLDWKKPFTLVNGTGWLTGAEYSPETGMASINVGYNPYV